MTPTAHAKLNAQIRARSTSLEMIQIVRARVCVRMNAQQIIFVMTLIAHVKACVRITARSALKEMILTAHVIRSNALQNRVPSAPNEIN